MSKFPQPVELPPDIQRARDARNKALILTSIYGIMARIGIIAMELTGVWMYGSSSLLMDAIATILDVVGSLFLIYCIKMASRPPDTNHPFGHGRIEPLAGLLMGVMLIVVGAVMFFQQIFENSTIKHGEAIYGWLWVIPLIAMVILEMIYRVLKSVAKKHDSAALGADAAHFRIDSITSLLALVALFLGAMLPEWSQTIDHAGAYTIIAVMMVIGFFASRENMNQLVDKTPSPYLFAKVRNAALTVKGVLETEKIRIQQYGPDAHVDIDIEVDPQLSVEKAHKISQQTRAAIQKDWPFVRDVTVHVEPYYPNDH